MAKKTIMPYSGATIIMVTTTSFIPLTIGKVIFGKVIFGKVIISKVIISKVIISKVITGKR